MSLVLKGIITKKIFYRKGSQSQSLYIQISVDQWMLKFKEGMNISSFLLIIIQGLVMFTYCITSLIYSLEMFKEYMSEVENQLSKSIKTL